MSSKLLISLLTSLLLICNFGICANDRLKITNLEPEAVITNLLSDVLLNSLQLYKCMVVVTDEIYYNIFQHVLYKKFGVYISFFMVFIKESEDLLSPYQSTKEALIMAKAHGCQIYIILISNGLQTSRLLQFGDRYRVLDTRAKFIMLYDNRLFHKDIHYLWKRIVNVIFIREYGGSKKLGTNTRGLPWFEISTVPFPSPIQNVFVPRRLDIWTNSKFRFGVDLFRDKTRDLNNQTLKVIAFKHTPATIKLPFPEENTVRSILGEKPIGFAGLEVEILDAVSKQMNFKCDVYELPGVNSHFWGKKLAGGQYSGLIGEMVKSKADFALGDLYYISFILNLMDLTVPYNTECLTFLTPESLTDNSWKTLILPFQPSMWLCVMVCLFGIGIIMHYLALFHWEVTAPKRNRPKSLRTLIKKKQVLTLPLGTIDQLDPHSKYIMMMEQFTAKKREDDPVGLYLFAEFFNSMLYTCSMLLMVSLPKLPTGWSLRLLTGWYWIYCTLVVVSYRASMTAILANPVPRVTIDTLEELADSKLSLGGWGEINREFFTTSLDPAAQLIGFKYEEVNNSHEAIGRVIEGKFAFYENVHYLKEISISRHSKQSPFSSGNSSGDDEERNDRNLHIMRDCVINMPISIGLQKNSPIKPRVDKYIRRVLEAGFIKKWLDDVMQPTLNAELPSSASTENTKALMSMRKFIGAIVALFVGYFVSVIALVIEICYFYCLVKKHPDFDKFSKRVDHGHILDYYIRKMLHWFKNLKFLKLSK
nr:glutamate receptor ionotropic, delta-1 [Onthophagus taurus]